MNMYIILFILTPAFNQSFYFIGNCKKDLLFIFILFPKAYYSLGYDFIQSFHQPVPVYDQQCL